MRDPFACFCSHVSQGFTQTLAGSLARSIEAAQAAHSCGTALQALEEPASRCVCVCLAQFKPKQAAVSPARSVLEGMAEKPQALPSGPCRPCNLCWQPTGGAALHMHASIACVHTARLLTPLLWLMPPCIKCKVHGSCNKPHGHRHARYMIVGVLSFLIFEWWRCECTTGG